MLGIWQEKAERVFSNTLFYPWKYVSMQFSTMCVYTYIYNSLPLKAFDGSLKQKYNHESEFCTEQK